MLSVMDGIRFGMGFILSPIALVLVLGLATAAFFLIKRLYKKITNKLESN